jgi:hypothetical protein
VEPASLLPGSSPLNSESPFYSDIEHLTHFLDIERLILHECAVFVFQIT